MAVNILLLYGPKTRTTAKVEKTRRIRNRIQVRKANGTVPLYGSKTRTPLSAKRLARNESGFRLPHVFPASSRIVAGQNRAKPPTHR